MIKCEYDRKTHAMTTYIQGDSDAILTELHCIIEKVLDSFHVYDQELLVLEEITDVVSEFAEKHTPKSKGEKKDD